jgi:hypothetical protein
MEAIERVNSSVVFGGTGEAISVFKDHVLIDTPRQQGRNAVEFRYEELRGLYLHIGVFYATLTLHTGNGYGQMIRWLPKGKAFRVASYIRKHIRPGYIREHNR